MTGRSEMRRVLVRLDARQKAARDFLGGILHYAAFHPNWDVRIADGHPKNSFKLEWCGWRPDGLVTDRALSAKQMRLLRKTGLRGVILAYGKSDDIPKGSRLFVRRIVCDHEAVGRAGARFLIGRGLRHFAYVPELVADRCLTARCRAFCQSVAEEGCDVSVYRRSSVRCRDEDSLKKWILGLPKPCGIMAAFDQRAKDVLDACRAAEVGIPEQVLLIGVDDESYICENTRPTLTSVLPDFGGAGFHAAEVLEGLLAGQACKEATWTYGVSKIVERVSTADVSGTARCTALAKDFIRREYASIRDVSTVAEAVGTSVRLLEMHFRKALGTTVVRELQRVRLENVKRLLTETDKSLSRIAEACGFDNESYLKTLFRRQFGKTMAGWRKTGEL